MQFDHNCKNYTHICEGAAKNGQQIKFLLKILFVLDEI